MALLGEGQKAHHLPEDFHEFEACNRELGELAAPGGATAAATVLFLALAWSGVEAPQALADINIPYQVQADPLAAQGNYRISDSI